MIPNISYDTVTQISAKYHKNAEEQEWEKKLAIY